MIYLLFQPSFYTCYFMIKNISSLIPVTSIACLLLLTGCVTPQATITRAEVNASEDSRRLQETLRRYEGRMDGLELELKRVRTELDQIRADQAQVMDNTLALSDGLETRLKELSNRQAQDKQELINTLSTKIAAMIKTAFDSPKRKSRGPKISPYGVEHVVERGQTLSAIAQAYGVKMEVIMAANNLKNPDSLRVNQKLFIPD